MVEDQNQGGLVSNILAVVGFLILIGIIIWGAYNLLSGASVGLTSLSSLFSSSAIPVTISDDTVQSGQPFDVTWRHSAVTGSYSLLYPCRADIEFRQPGPTALELVPCGQTHTVSNSETKTVRLVPISHASSSLDVTFSIVYFDAAATSSATRPEGSATITVTNAAPSGSAAPTQTPVRPTTPTTPTTPTAPAMTGPADFAVRILAIGVIDPATNQFVQRPPMSPNDIAAVRFDIMNAGAGPSGAWAFTATLPTNPTQPYQSPQQKSLNPGDHIENILRFNRVTPGGGAFTVVVDPQGAVKESNESNNSATQFVSASGYAY